MSCTEITQQFLNNFSFVLRYYNVNLALLNYVNAIRSYIAMILKCANKTLDLSILFLFS